MKKTVSINIGGIIFHIEEDGYEKLKSYLESVTKYFSTFEDSDEITSDIEGRIAEIFLMKLSDGRQTVSLEDVNEVITTMGTTKDFQATIETEEPELGADSKEETQEEREATSDKSGESHKRLYRDGKRRILGGVAAGMAHYFSLDPLWIRLLFIVLFINVLPFNIGFGGFAGAVFLIYIILWIVLPENNSLEDDKKVKKLFRNSDERVIGGVASGLASYFGTDLAVIRLIFVISIFLGGTGLIVYIILWIITPEAKTITEKMQMQGEPVTLSNIESNVKKSLNVKEGEESAIVKILLFPFRLIALIISGIGKALGPILRFLVELIRIIFGSMLVLVGFVMMISFIAVGLALLGIGSWEGIVHLGNLPLNLIHESLSFWPVFSLFLVAFIPALALVLVGFVVILKRSVGNAYIGWSMFALWIFGLIVATFSIPEYVREFSSENDYRTVQDFEVTQATPLLKLHEVGDPSFDRVSLQIRGHEDSVYQLVQRITSRGRDRVSAEDNAKSINYKVNKEGEDFLFDSDITFPEGSSFRFQEVDLTFYVPYGKAFRMDEDLVEIITNTYGYRRYQLENNDWVFSANGLECLTCPGERIDRDDSITRNQGKRDDGESLTYPFEDFSELRISSLFDVEIRKGEEYGVEIRGDDNDLDEVYLNQVGDLLEVKYKEDQWKVWEDNDRERIKLFVTMPELEYLEMNGYCDGEILGFDNYEIEIKLTGASDIYVNVFTESLRLDLTGASKVNLKGSGEKLEAELIGASELNAFDYEAETISIDAIGASKAEIYGTEEIRIKAAGVSRVKYRGTSNTSITEQGLSQIERD